MLRSWKARQAEQPVAQKRRSSNKLWFLAVAALQGSDKYQRDTTRTFSRIRMSAPHEPLRHARSSLRRTALRSEDMGMDFVESHVWQNRPDMGRQAASLGMKSTLIFFSFPAG